MSNTLRALKLAESFMSGFEDDDVQKGIKYKLSVVRAAINWVQTTKQPTPKPQSQHTPPIDYEQRLKAFNKEAFQLLDHAVYQTIVTFKSKDMERFKLACDQERAIKAYISTLDHGAENRSNVATETGKTPRQLAEENKELVKALSGLLESYAAYIDVDDVTNADIVEPVTAARAALQKAGAK